MLVFEPPNLLKAPEDTESSENTESLEDTLLRWSDKNQLLKDIQELSKDIKQSNNKLNQLGLHLVEKTLTNIIWRQCEYAIENPEGILSKSNVLPP